MRISQLCRPCTFIASISQSRASTSRIMADSVRRLLKAITGDEEDIYGLDHAILNVIVPPEKMWMNMGYWKVCSILGAEQHDAHIFQGLLIRFLGRKFIPRCMPGSFGKSSTYGRSAWRRQIAQERVKLSTIELAEGGSEWRAIGRLSRLDHKIN